MWNRRLRFPSLWAILSTFYLYSVYTKFISVRYLFPLYCFQNKAEDGCLPARSLAVGVSAHEAPASDGGKPIEEKQMRVDRVEIKTWKSF